MSIDNKFSRFSFLPKLKNIEYQSNSINMLDDKIYKDNKLLKFEEISKIEKVILEDKTQNKEYVSIYGDIDFNNSALNMCFEFNKDALKDLTYFSFLTFSRGGAMISIFNFISKYYPSLVFTPKLRKNIYKEKLEFFNMFVNEYEFFKFKEDGVLDFENLYNEINNIAFGSFIILPMTETDYTGYTITNDQWKKIADLVKEKRLIPIIDMPYQGLFSGDLKKDSYPINYFLGSDLFIAQNLDHNFGVHSERIACVHLFTSKNNLKNIKSQVNLTIRTLYCNPHKFGPWMISKILSNNDSKINHYNQLENVMKEVQETKKILSRKLNKNYFNLSLHQGVYIDLNLCKDRIDYINSKGFIYPNFNGILNLTLLNEKYIDNLTSYLNENN